MNTLKIIVYISLLFLNWIPGNLLYFNGLQILKKIGNITALLIIEFSPDSSIIAQ